VQTLFPHLSIKAESLQADLAETMKVHKRKSPPDALSGD
jgi:hypothetical protein